MSDADKPVIVGEIELAPGRKFSLESKTRTKRGSGGGEQYTLLRPVIPPEAVIDLLKSKLNEGGNSVLENFLLREVIFPAANEATSECWVTDAVTGEVSINEAKFVEVFWDQFVPSDRRRTGGVTKKDLETKLQAVMPAFTEAVNSHTQAERAYMAALEQAIKNRTGQPDKTKFVPEELSNRVAQLLLEVNQLTAAIEKKARPGAGPKGPRKPRAAKSTEPVAA